MNHTSWTGGTRPVHKRGSLGLHRQSNHCNHVALQRMSWMAMTAKTTIGEEDPRVSPALVYRDRITEDSWVVEPPDGLGTRAFVGPNARSSALEFAHRTYGSARYFSV